MQSTHQRRKTYNLKDTVKPQDFITNINDLPQGTTFEWNGNDGVIDTITAGSKTGEVLVTYPDGSSEVVVVHAEVDVTLTVDPYDNDQYTLYPHEGIVVNKNDTIDAKSSVDVKDAHTNDTVFPGGTVYEWVTPPDTSTSGDHSAQVRVTYGDGTQSDSVTVNTTCGLMLKLTIRKQVR